MVATRHALAPAGPRTSFVARAPAGIAFVVAYLLLERVSFIAPATPFGFTLWNPPAALSVMLALSWGRTAAIPIAAGVFLAAVLVRDVPGMAAAPLLSTFVLTVGYTALGMLLSARGDAAEQFSEPVAALGFCVAAMLGAGVIAAVHLGALSFLGEIGGAQMPSVLARLWIGDATGIGVLLPALVRFGSRARLAAGLRELAQRETLAVSAAAAALAAASILGPNAATSLAYLVILPVVWIAVRRGLDATIAALLVIQLAIVVLAMTEDTRPAAFLEFQVLMIVVALTGLVLGSAVSSVRATLAQRARGQIDAERLARITATGALGSAIAHELSQPITAIRTAAHVAARRIENDGGPPDVARALQTIEREIAQASDRIRRLRAGFQDAGATPVAVDLRAAASAALRLASGLADLPDRRIEIAPASVGLAFADAAHVEHILLNLVRNAGDAIRERGADGRVRIAFADDSGSVQVVVSDNGAGVPDEIRDGLFDPMVSGRADGIGLGLYICRTLAELNGGTVAHARDPDGWTVFTLSLPKAALR